MKKLIVLISILIVIGLLNFPGCTQPQPSSPPVICKVAAGSDHSVALDDKGNVYTWGFNYYGQLGIGTNDSEENKPCRIYWLTEKVVAIAAGVDHTLVVTESGAVYTWGLNSHGQLGDGTKTNQNKPVKVSGLPENDKITAVAAGYHFSLALGTSGKVYAWGDSSYGELGNGPLTASLTPVTVKKATGGDLTGVKKIAAGAYHSLALVDTGGIPQACYWVFAWGCNEFGQLGNDSTNNSSFPVNVSYYNIDTKTILTGIVDISGWGHHSLAANQNGQAWSWGENNVWQLGLSDKSNHLTASQVLFPASNYLVDKVATGGQHSAVALRNTGYVYSFGTNAYGQLGNPASVDSYNPVQVALPDGGGYLSEIVAIAAGSGHTLAVNSNGQVFAWGSNTYGQIGDGTIVQRNFPVKVKWQ